VRGTSGSGWVTRPVQGAGFGEQPPRGCGERTGSQAPGQVRVGTGVVTVQGGLVDGKLLLGSIRVPDRPCRRPRRRAKPHRHRVKVPVTLAPLLGRRTRRTRRPRPRDLSAVADRASDRDDLDRGAPSPQVRDRRRESRWRPAPPSRTMPDTTRSCREPTMCGASTPTKSPMSCCGWP
jgi:hypothetical protein